MSPLPWDDHPRLHGTAKKTFPFRTQTRPKRGAPAAARGRRLARAAGLFDDVGDQRVLIAAQLLGPLLDLGRAAPVKPSMLWIPSSDQDQIGDRRAKKSRALDSNEPASPVAPLDRHLPPVRVVSLFPATADRLT